MGTILYVAIGTIVLVAFVVVLRRLARDNEPVQEVERRPTRDELLEANAVYERDYMSSDALPPSWRETERLRKKHREQERARKRRQRNRKGGRS